MKRKTKLSIFILNLRKSVGADKLAEKTGMSRNMIYAYTLHHIAPPLDILKKMHKLSIGLEYFKHITLDDVHKMYDEAMKINPRKKPGRKKSIK